MNLNGGIVRGYFLPKYSAHKDIPEPFRKRNHLHLPLYLKAANGFTTYSAPSLDTSKAYTVVGTQQPGQTLTFNFTNYVPSQQLGLSDYILIQFEPDAFDKETRYTLTNIAPTSQAYVMPTTNLIVLQPEMVIKVSPDPAAWGNGLYI